MRITNKAGGGCPPPSANRKENDMIGIINLTAIGVVVSVAAIGAMAGAAKAVETLIAFAVIGAIAAVAGTILWIAVGILKAIIRMAAVEAANAIDNRR